MESSSFSQLLCESRNSRFSFMSDEIESLQTCRASDDVFSTHVHSDLVTSRLSREDGKPLPALPSTKENRSPLASIDQNEVKPKSLKPPLFKMPRFSNRSKTRSPLKPRISEPINPVKQGQPMSNNPNVSGSWTPMPRAASHMNFGPSFMPDSHPVDELDQSMPYQGEDNPTTLPSYAVGKQLKKSPSKIKKAQRSIMGTLSNLTDFGRGARGESPKCQQVHDLPRFLPTDMFDNARCSATTRAIQKRRDNLEQHIQIFHRQFKGRARSTSSQAISRGEGHLKLLTQVISCS